MLERRAALVPTTLSLEDELAEQETLAMTEQAEVDRLRAWADDLEVSARHRLSSVAAARSVLYGESPPTHVGHDEPFCYESFPDIL
jgi:hypothetical protein